MTFDNGKIVTFERKSSNFVKNEYGNVVLKNNPIGKEPKILDVVDKFNGPCILLFELVVDLKLQL